MSKQLQMGTVILYPTKPKRVAGTVSWVSSMKINKKLTVTDVFSCFVRVKECPYNYPLNGFIIISPPKIIIKTECINTGKYCLTKGKVYEGEIKGGYIYVNNDKNLIRRYSIKLFKNTDKKSIIENAVKKLNKSTFVNTNSLNISCGIKEIPSITGFYNEALRIQRKKLSLLEQPYAKEIAIQTIVSQIKEKDQNPAFYIASCNINNYLYPQFKKIMELLGADETEARLNKNSDNDIKLFIIKTRR